MKVLFSWPVITTLIGVSILLIGVYLGWWPVGTLFEVLVIWQFVFVIHAISSIGVALNKILIALERGKLTIHLPSDEVR